MRAFQYNNTEGYSITRHGNYVHISSLTPTTVSLDGHDGPTVCFGLENGFDFVVHGTKLHSSVLTGCVKFEWGCESNQVKSLIQFHLDSNQKKSNNVRTDNGDEEGIGAQELDILRHITGSSGYAENDGDGEVPRS